MGIVQRCPASQASRNACAVLTVSLRATNSLVARRWASLTDFACGGTKPHMAGTQSRCTLGAAFLLVTDASVALGLAAAADAASSAASVWGSTVPRIKPDMRRERIWRSAG